jgi:hypothetical protein
MGQAQFNAPVWVVCRQEGRNNKAYKPDEAARRLPFSGKIILNISWLQHNMDACWLSPQAVDVVLFLRQKIQGIPQPVNSWSQQNSLNQPNYLYSELEMYGTNGRYISEPE